MTIMSVAYKKSFPMNTFFPNMGDHGRCHLRVRISKVYEEMVADNDLMNIFSTTPL